MSCRLNFPIAGRFYKHYKGGQYRIICNAKKVYNQEHVVVYIDTRSCDIWIRDLDDFNQKGKFVLEE